MSYFAALTPKGNNNFGLARDQVVHLETVANLCASRPQAAIEVGQRFSLGIVIQEKGFIIAKTNKINKAENLNILCVQVLIWRQNRSPAFGNSLFDGYHQVRK